MSSTVTMAMGTITVGRAQAAERLGPGCQRHQERGAEHGTAEHHC